MGTVESVERETITIRPKHEELKDLLTFPAGQLRKYFKKVTPMRVTVNCVGRPCEGHHWKI
jgi:hypothetical protein